MAWAKDADRAWPTDNYSLPTPAVNLALVWCWFAASRLRAAFWLVFVTDWFSYVHNYLLYPRSITNPLFSQVDRLLGCCPSRYIWHRLCPPRNALFRGFFFLSQLPSAFDLISWISVPCFPFARGWQLTHKKTGQSPGRSCYNIRVANVALLLF